MLDASTLDCNSLEKVSFDNEDNDEEVHIPLLANQLEKFDKLDCLLGETLGKVLLDS